MGSLIKPIFAVFLSVILASTAVAEVDDLKLVEAYDEEVLQTSDDLRRSEIRTPMRPGEPVGVNLTVNITGESYAVLDKNNNSEYDSGTDFIQSKEISSTGDPTYIGNFSSEETSSLSHGNYTVYGLQNDTINDGYNLSREINTNLQIDNVTPNITNFELSNYNSSHFQVSFNANESLGEIEANLYKEEAQEDSKNLYAKLTESEFSNSSLTYTGFFKKGVDANYTASLLEAKDLAGNTADEKPNSSHVYDAGGPTYSDLNPSDFTSSLQPLISIAVGDFDGVNSDTIEINLNDSSGKVLENVSTSKSGIQFSNRNLSINLTELSESLTEGEVNFSVESSDNTGESSNFTSSFLVDENAPSIYGFNGTNVSSDKIGVEFESLEQLSTIRVRVKGPESSTLSYLQFSEESASTNYIYKTNYTISNDGNFSLEFDKAEDVYGNNREDYSIEEYVVKEEETEVDSFSAKNVTEDKIYLSFNSSEQLDNILVNVTGPEDVELTEADFSTGDSSAPYNYSATYKAGYDGTYNFELTNANDSYGGFKATDGVTTNSVEIDRLPEIHDFELYYSGTDVDLKINSSVQLSNIKAWVRSDDGSINDNRTEADFSETYNGYWLYENDVATSSGTYNATLYRAEDSNGNDAADQQFDEILLNADSPQDPLDTKLEEYPNSYNENSLHVNTTFDSVPGDDITLWLGATHEDGTVDNTTFYFASPSKKYLNDSLDISGFPDGEITIWSRVEKGGYYNPSNYTASKTFVKDTDRPEIISGYTGGIGGNSSKTGQIVLNVSDNETGIDKSSVSALKVQVNSSKNPDTPLALEDVSYSNGKMTIDLMDDLKSDETAELKLTGNITDEYDQEINTTPIYTIQDGLRPLATSAVVNSSASTSSNTVVDVEFNENFTATSASAEIDGLSVTVSDTSSPKAYLQASGVLETSSASLTSFTGLVDDAGNTAAPDDGSIKVKSFERELVSGWNLVSFPIADGKSYSISSLIDTSKIDTVWSYNGGEWRIYEPGAPSDFTSIKGGEGYLVKANTDFTLAPQVDTKDDESADTSMNIETGWNLVGHVEEYNQTADTSGSFSSLSSVNTVRAQTADGSLTYGATTYAVPGDAYWVDSGSSDTLTGGFAAEAPQYFSILDKIWNSIVSLVNL